MQQVELTLFRAFKVFWSWIWRAWILMFAGTVALTLIGFAIFFFIGGINIMSLGKFNPTNFGATTVLLIVVLYFAAIIGMFCLQAYAFKLALKVTWSDFKLVPVATVAVPQSPSSSPAPRAIDIG